MKGTAFTDPEKKRVVTAVRLGAQPIAALAIQGAPMSDSVVQSIANLVAIGLERAKAQELAQEVEVTRRSERLRSTILDAMAHEFKTPLTSIRAATSALLASAASRPENGAEMLKIADEEAARLEELIDNALDMAKIDSDHIDINSEPSDVRQAVRDLVNLENSRNGDHRLTLSEEDVLPAIAFDRRLVKLALKQVLDNAIKYSPPASPIAIHVFRKNGSLAVEITDHGKGIPVSEQTRIFERFYRSPSIENHVPGSGLGLSIAHRIARAHGGDLTVRSKPGETTFCLLLPIEPKEN